MLLTLILTDVKMIVNFLSSLVCIIDLHWDGDGRNPTEFMGMGTVVVRILQDRMYCCRKFTECFLGCLLSPYMDCCFCMVSGLKFLTA